MTADRWRNFGSCVLESRKLKTCATLPAVIDRRYNYSEPPAGKRAAFQSMAMRIRARPLG